MITITITINVYDTKYLQVNYNLNEPSVEKNVLFTLLEKGVHAL